MPDSTNDLGDTIKAAANEPARASGDEGSFDARSIDELIAADNHLAGKAAVKSPRRGLFITKLSPPGGA